MHKLLLLALAATLLGFVVLLTWPGEHADPCIQDQAVSGAILAEDDDQDGLVNRAIIVRGECDDGKRD